jgi:glycosyltransferase involved in cell wall biosynthesis
MKIGIITDFIDGKHGGIGVYAHNLIKKLNEIDFNNQYYLIHYLSIEMPIYNANEEIPIKKYSLPKGSGALWRYICTPLKLKSMDKLDIVHDPFEIGPMSFNMPFKKVITVHDLTPILFPHTFSIASVLLHKILLKRTLYGADKIITDSKSTKNDLINYFEISDEKIKVIPLGVDEKFKPMDPEKVVEFKINHNLDFPFLLYVGTLEPRKNIPTLIKAFSKLKSRNLNYKLVIAGKKGWKYNTIFNTIDDLNLQNDVVFTGYISDDDLPLLYNAADVFVYPSIYEGFGLPPLEAMACGTPVITSNTSSLPEVVGDAGILLDPMDIDGFANLIYAILFDEELRLTIVKKGLERSKMFNWGKCARETLSVYENIFE